ncbi:MAG: tRNA pseudouridine(55) synthase TruB [Chloroflexi bacterium]|nr:tRNA pseudouridine(55) synthase TruB [Chloroflexota bacterium]
MNTRTKVEADGALVINKPKAITSMDVVRAVRRITRVKRVGHAGTLDPIAEGVLPVCLGQATRFMDYLVDSGKTYIGEITFGAATDTYDSEGEQTATGDYASLSREQIEEQLAGFSGVVMQQPPMYSAVKHEGQRLYDLARAGVEVERPAREVVVHKVTLFEWAPPRAAVKVDCGKGFYMRSLAHDLGEALGCPAHLSALTRTRVGPFSLDDALTIEQLATEEDWEGLLEPPDAALRDIPALLVPSTGERHLRNGQPVNLPGSAPYAKHLEPRRAYTEDGCFLGLVRFNRAESSWKPEKMLAKPVLSRYAPEP